MNVLKYFLIILTLMFIENSIKKNNNIQKIDKQTSMQTSMQKKTDKKKT